MKTDKRLDTDAIIMIALAVALIVIAPSAYFVGVGKREDRSRIAKLTAQVDELRAPACQRAGFRTAVLKQDRKAKAPFKVRVAAGSADFYVKLVNPSNDEILVAMTVKAGDELEAQMPLGTHELRYATGQLWCGEQELFGPATDTYRAESVMEAQVVGEQIVGASVLLEAIPGGNLTTSAIPRSEF
jgi:hypothetical protein